MHVIESSNPHDDLQNCINANDLHTVIYYHWCCFNVVSRVFIIFVSWIPLKDAGFKMHRVTNYCIRTKGMINQPVVSIRLYDPNTQINNSVYEHSYVLAVLSNYYVSIKYHYMNKVTNGIVICFCCFSIYVDRDCNYDNIGRVNVWLGISQKCYFGKCKYNDSIGNLIIPPLNLHNNFRSHQKKIILFSMSSSNVIKTFHGNILSPNGTRNILIAHYDSFISNHSL